METNKNTARTALIVGLKLLLICAVVAGVVSFVYSVTIDAYNQNLENEIRKSISTIFDASEADVIDYTSDSVEDSDIKAFYTVTKNGETVGYCVNVIGKGFGGEISLMVGYHADGTIRGVSVVSHSETAGVGEKAMKEEYLKQYTGLSGMITVSKGTGTDVTAISGATISSKAINAAMNRANEFLRNRGVAG